MTRPNGFSICEKTIAEERGILMPLVKDIIDTDVYDHLTWSGAQSLGCLLPIFDPDGVGQNPLDFFLFTV
jgi:hypothetical protein